ncbi:MAG: 4-hydroxybenzoate octaprenyltransferase [Pseudomonadota bacterium]
MRQNLRQSECRDGSVSDSVQGNWVDARAPGWTRPYLRLSRADRPVGTWLLLIPCWWGLALAILADPAGANGFDAWIAIGCAAGAFLMRGAGCTWNDYTDRHFDAAVARTRSRPLPSGQITPKAALVWMCLQAILAFGILLTFPLSAILFGLGSLAVVCLYPFAKRFTWWPQVFLGLAFNWGIPLAWLAHGNGLGMSVLLAYVAGVSWTLFYDTMYAHQDKTDDALIGVKSTARLFGKTTKSWLILFVVTTISGMTGAVVLTRADAFPMTISLFGVACFGMHLCWQLRVLDIDAPDVCLSLFRTNREAGLLLTSFVLIASLL